MKIKILKEDKVFSQVIRLRDKKCVRCGSPVRYNEKGIPNSHECSHYWSRGNWSTRYEKDNCDTLCFACHMLWGGDHREEYTEFKKEQLGEERYNEMKIQRHKYVNKKKLLAEVYPIYKEKLLTLTN